MPSKSTSSSSTSSDHCATCNKCANKTNCPKATTPYNKHGDAGMQCYECASCSHGLSITPVCEHRDPDALVYCPVRIDYGTAKVKPWIVALAEIENNRAAIFANKESLPKEAKSGLVIPVWHNPGETKSPEEILAIAREKVKEELRELKGYVRMVRAAKNGVLVRPKDPKKRKGMPWWIGFA